MKKPSRSDIPIGKVNSITRKRLSWLWAKTDRATQEQIEVFRKDPNADDIIITLSDGSGYWRSRDVDEIRDYKSEIDAQIQSLHILSMTANRIIENLSAEASQTGLPF